MRTLRLVFPLALTLAGFAACGGGGLVTTDAQPATGGAVGTGGTSIGAGGTIVGAGGNSGLGAGSPGGEGGEASTGFGGAAPECDRHVHILLQKSGAVFQSPAAEDNWWDAIADALAGDDSLVQEFDAQVELSVSVFSKNNAADTETCPLGAELSAPIDKGDLADTLAEEKDEFEQLILESVKVDAPVVEAVEGATELLSGEASGYIVLVVSDIPDSCSVDNQNCTAQDVFGAVQAAHDAGIETRLVYLHSGGANIEGYPQGVANAGVGEGIGLPPVLIGACNSFDYSDTPGSASFEAPENTAAVRQALADILGDIAACD